MENKKILVVAGLVGIVAGITYSINVKSNTVQQLQIDTVQKQDTAVAVKGKRALFIGDSHTANHDFGWQVQVSKQTGLIMTNTAVGGKMTSWMVSIAKQYVNRNYDYCFVYGGANDCYSSLPIEKVLNNLQTIANICADNKVKCYILTGFNPITCVKTNTGYPKHYDNLQKRMFTDLKNCTVIDCREVVTRNQCWDWLCHMNYDGHKAIGECVIKACKFKKISK
jgi:hypothetical protein